jgi:hypothetical protein
LDIAIFFGHNHLVGGLEHFYFCHSVGNVIIPTAELNDFSEGWRKTTNQIIINHD